MLENSALQTVKSQQFKPYFVSKRVCKTRESTIMIFQCYRAHLNGYFIQCLHFEYYYCLFSTKMLPIPVDVCTSFNLEIILICRHLFNMLKCPWVRHEYPWAFKSLSFEYHSPSVSLSCCKTFVVLFIMTATVVSFDYAGYNGLKWWLTLDLKYQNVNRYFSNYSCSTILHCPSAQYVLKSHSPPKYSKRLVLLKCRSIKRGDSDIVEVYLAIT